MISNFLTKSANYEILIKYYEQFTTLNNVISVDE